jgi:hypothetical protein
MSEQLYDGRILVRLEERDDGDCYDAYLFAAPPNLTSEEQVHAAIERAFEEVLAEDADRGVDDQEEWTHGDLHRRLLSMGFMEVPYITWDYELWRR